LDVTPLVTLEGGARSVGRTIAVLISTAAVGLIVNNAVSSFLDHGTNVESTAAAAVAAAAVSVLAAAGVGHASAERDAGFVVGSTRDDTVSAALIGFAIGHIVVGGNCVQCVSSSHVMYLVNMRHTLPSLSTSSQSGQDNGGD